MYSQYATNALITAIVSCVVGHNDKEMLSQIMYYMGGKYGHGYRGATHMTVQRPLLKSIFAVLVSVTKLYMIMFYKPYIFH